MKVTVRELFASVRAQIAWPTQSVPALVDSANWKGEHTASTTLPNWRAKHFLQLQWRWGWRTPPSWATCWSHRNPLPHCPGNVLFQFPSFLGHPGSNSRRIENHTNNLSFFSPPPPSDTCRPLMLKSSWKVYQTFHDGAFSSSVS